MTNEHETVLIDTIVEQHLDTDITSITPLKGGFFSRAFIVSSGGQDYVVRINAAPHARESFEKDDYAWRHFADRLPIPRVVAIGEAGDEWYAISERLPGVTLSGLTAAERDGLLPAIIDMLGGIGSTDISGSRGTATGMAAATASSGRGRSIWRRSSRTSRRGATTRTGTGYSRRRFSNGTCTRPATSG